MSELASNPAVDSKAVMAAGSKSFSFAAALFSKEEREGAALLYRWCRYCDDIVDDCTTEQEKLLVVADLKAKTQRAFDPNCSFPGEPAFEALQTVALRFGIPQQYALDLIRGFELDAKNQRYESWEDLDRYGYHVAGTVGLMMCFVMGVKNREALPHAVHMGIAMQLTNIARDVAEDLRMGRVYLPLAELQKRGLIQDSDLDDPAKASAVWSVVEGLLLRADQHYVLGLEGIRYLPWRAALTIRVAAYVYRKIGSVLQEQSVTERLHVRASTTFWEKCLSIGTALWHQVTGKTPSPLAERSGAISTWRVG